MWLSSAKLNVHMPPFLLTATPKIVFSREARFACQLTETALFTLQSGEQLSNIKEHTKQINDIQTSRDMTMFITASKDNTAKVRPPVGLWCIADICLQESCSKSWLPQWFLFGNLSTKAKA